MTKKPVDLSRPLDLDNYQDLEGISVNKLNIGLWIISHKRNFVIILISFLLVISAIFYSYSIYNYIDYFFITGPKEKQTIAQLGQSDSVLSEAQRLKNLAKPIVILDTKVFLSNGKYDLLAQAENPNDNFSAEFSYCFMDNGVQLACGQSFIFPLEKKYIYLLATDLTKRPLQPQAALTNTTWARINLHQYPDWTSFYQDHLNFAVENINFITGNNSQDLLTATWDTLGFKITNHTPFNYWEVPLDIIMLSGNIPVAVNSYQVQDIGSGATRSVKMAWPNSLPSVDKILVLPDVNILNDAIYKNY